MSTFRDQTVIVTKHEGDVINITPWMADRIKSSGLRQGIACVMVRHSTAAVALIEDEPGLKGDLIRSLDRMIPKDAPYAHNAAWGDGNGHSHIRSTMLGQSVTFAFAEGRPDLGTWQQLVLIELDNKGRERTITVQLVGE
ncbi:MAG: YjbQ family protein [Methanomassiliicoccales archaeon]|nr:MAG: YjbQ family protein [Methanomassiliicoccales archaeon]